VNILRTLPGGAPRAGARTKIGRRGAMLLSFAAALILVSAAKQPYWLMRLQAPQYPQGLVLRVYLDHVEGDVDEINTLNHYIGVKHIDDAAQLERKIGLPALYVLAGSLLLLPFAGRKKLALLAIPAVGFPAGFALDLAYWMHRLSSDLDPRAPVHLKPFSFALAGDSKIGQFLSHTAFTTGFMLATLVTILVLAAVVAREIVACRACPHRATCGLVCRGALPWTPRS
jgi:copper chaperone NosL